MSQTEVFSTAVISDQPALRSTGSKQDQIIAGYQLQHRIGVGGYGEVWRAIGPGGFPKAVKLLFGQVDGPQAETELKSLNLMRELRHPFLLNVERVELVDGRLIVVTELADCSLDQKFNEILAAGGRGISRADLIGYLKDAADALDFMSDHHGLQHLDIKPENLLLQGAHAKVGDFGLTKSVAMARHSLVQGFTPLYSPPELFEGRATRNSDQYSLAIVFQTMLTGVPPFNGRTAAQLTAQHLHSRPDLSPLSNGDRSVVARALSKNADSRFNGCRQFIDELARRRSSGSSARSNATAENEAETDAHQTTRQSLPGQPTSPIQQPAHPLSPVDGFDHLQNHRPALMIGVGGLGCHVLDCLLEKLHVQFPDQTLPGIGFVKIDTDVEQLRKQDTASARPRRQEITELAIPLRTPQQYRKESSDHLSWLSRRWLFNIPRSGNVEGMRPLGRLAFVDHQKRIQELLAQVLCRILSEDSRIQTERETGLELESDALDICIIGSTSGGTASGILLDLAFQLRRLLHLKSVPHRVRISAMMLHGTSAGGRQTEAQDANSVSFLQELHHFTLPGVARPADVRVSGSTSHHPFDAAWFVHLGEHLTAEDYHDHARHLSEYLRLWTLSPVRRILECWRSTEQPSAGAGDELVVRTLGYATVDPTSERGECAEASRLILRCIQQWLKPMNLSAQEPAARTTLEQMAAETVPELEHLFESVSLTNRQVVEYMPDLLRGDIGRRIEAYAQNVWDRISVAAPNVSDPDSLAKSIAALISDDAADGSGTPDSVARMTQMVRQSLMSRLQKSCKQLNLHLITMLDKSHRLGRVHFTLAACLNRIQAATAACAAQRGDVQRTFSDLCNNFVRPVGQNSPAAAPAAARSFCQQYCMLMICQSACQSVLSHLTSLKEYVEKQQLELSTKVRNHLLVVSEGLAGHRPVAADLDASAPLAFDQFLLSQGQFSLSALVRGDLTPDQASAVLLADANRFLTKRSASINAANSDTVTSTVATTTNFPAAAHPVLSQVGGGQRVLTIVPRGVRTELWKNRIQAEFGNCVQTATDDISEVAAYCEVSGIAIPAVVDALTKFRPHVSEMAGRLHTRKDIAW